MITELISVIVPIYNVEQYLNRCVKSILQQTYRNLEIILVDDGSPDDCGGMCDRYAMQDSRIKVIHKKNEGLGCARNSGLDVATGEYIIFVDSDDWIGSTHIENLYAMTIASRADMVIGGHTVVNESGMHKVRKPKIEQKTYQGEEIADKIILPLIGADTDCSHDVQMEASSCMNLYSAALIKKYALRFLSERDTVAEDQFFNLDYLHIAKRVAVCDEVGYYYYHNTQSISKKYHPQRFVRSIRYFYLLQDKIAAYNLSSKAESRARRSCFLKIRIAIRHVVNSDMHTGNKLREIKQILEHDVTRSVMEGLPTQGYVPAMRLLVFFMKEKCAAGVYCLMVLREGIGQRGIMKSVLKAVGISR